MPRAVRAAAMILVVACSADPVSAPLPPDSAANVTVTPLASIYAPGDTAWFRIVNGEPYTLAYNLCYAHIERRSGDAWTDIPRSNNCAGPRDAGYPVPANRSATDFWLVPTNLGDGTYRLGLTLVGVQELQSFVKRSSTFTIQR